jgi:acetyl esterase/lipase
MSKNMIREYFASDIPHDAILLIPGGGYGYHSPREGEPIAKLFNLNGYHAGVFEYRNELKVYPEIITEALDLIKVFLNNPLVKRLFLLGFSAGGHLALMLLEEEPAWFAGGILAYPVISTKPGLIHKQSFINLFGRQPNDQELRMVSLEDKVSKELPPIFVWHTMTDESVPVGNSLALINALQGVNVKVEAHLYPNGGHGLSIISKETACDGVDPDEFVKINKHVKTWVDLMFEWLNTI